MVPGKFTIPPRSTRRPSTPPRKMNQAGVRVGRARYTETIDLTGNDSAIPTLDLRSPSSLSARVESPNSHSGATTQPIQREGVDNLTGVESEDDGNRRETKLGPYPSLSEYEDNVDFYHGRSSRKENAKPKPRCRGPRRSFAAWETAVPLHHSPTDGAATDKHQRDPFATNYIGSEAERNELLRLYERYNGDLEAVRRRLPGTYQAQTQPRWSDSAEMRRLMRVLIEADRCDDIDMDRSYLVAAQDSSDVRRGKKRARASSEVTTASSSPGLSTLPDCDTPLPSIESDDDDMCDSRPFKYGRFYPAERCPSIAGFTSTKSRKYPSFTVKRRRMIRRNEHPCIRSRGDGTTSVEATLGSPGRDFSDFGLLVDEIDIPVVLLD